jgi:dimethylamine/trimethylamine dehydrogenase
MLGIKKVTTKPVVGVGRFTSPDTMASLIRRGVLDMIGAARPSIADPFLPKKIEEGRYDDIRECIGCNICVSGHFAMTNLRCTQNPTMGEEWRRGWHPERIPRAASAKSVLVVGSGPAGLECARALGERGYKIALAEKERSLGGRVTREGALPGLGEWLRVRDWRIGQINKLPNVSVYPESNLTASDIRDFGADHIVLATGSRWRRDGVGRIAVRPLPLADMALLTPDDIMTGSMPSGRVLLYDDDHYYMGAVLAEKLALTGAKVTLVTPAADVSAFTINTLENIRTAKRLDDLGIDMITHRALVGAANGEALFGDVRTGEASSIAADTLVLITARVPQNELFLELISDHALSVARIGDCEAPAAIFAAVYSGHRHAQELDDPLPLLNRERISLTP